MANVVLHSKDKLSIELLCANALRADAVIVALSGDPKFRIDLPSEQQFDIPDAILDAGKTRLLTAAEFKKKIKDLSDDIAAETKTLAREAKVAELQALERARAVLAEALATRRIFYQDGTTANVNFCGMMKTAAGGALTIDVTISLAKLLDEDDDAVIFEGVARITGAINKETLSLILTVRITRGGLKKLIPSIDIPTPAFKGLPKLDLAWPDFDFPNLSLPDFTFAGLDRLLRFDVPPFPGINLPTGKFPVEIEWSSEPQFSFAISSGELQVKTDAAGKGSLVVKDSLDNKVTFATIAGFELAFVSGALALKGTLAASEDKWTIYEKTFTPVNVPELPIVLRHDKEAATIALSLKDSSYDLAGTGKFIVTVTISLPRLVIEARDDPRIFLVLALGYEITTDGGDFSGKLTRLAIIEPYSIKLIELAAKTALSGVVRIIAALDTAVAGVAELIKRLAEFAAIFARHAAKAASAVGSILLDIGEAVVALISRIFALLAKGSQYIAIEIRLDATTYKPLQIWVSPLGSGNGSTYSAEAAGFTLTIAKGWRPALVIDVSAPRTVLALVLKPAKKASEADLVLATDLWYERQGGDTEAMRETDKEGKAPDKPLIEITGATPADAPPVIGLVVCEDGRFTFFRKLLEGTVDEQYQVDNKTLTLIKGRPRFGALTFGMEESNDLQIKVNIADNAKERLLPFLVGPPQEDADPQDSKGGLGQYIKIKEFKADAVKIENGAATVPISVEIALYDFKSDADLSFRLDLTTFKASLDGPGKLAIRGKEQPRTLLGLDALIKAHPPNPDKTAEFEQFVLDFRGGGVRFALSDKARLELWYRRIASEGRGLVFKVANFAVGRDGVDLEATADPDVPVTLAGVEVPFRFTEGGVSIKGGKLNSFSVTGKGQLPPRLIGEANLTASIAFGRKDGRLTFQSADVKLDKSGDPIVSKTTRFTFNLQKIELFARDFDADGIHFWFALTGSARSTGLPGGLAKNLTDLEIVGDKFPLTTNARVLRRYLTDFNVTVRMKRAINFFNVFKFELRSFGFYPSIDRFGGEPAIAISGQMNFALSGDVVSPKIDFHRMWIAPPKKGSALPQVAFDGLGVELKFGGAKLEATAISVDGELPSLAKDPAVVYEHPITAQGFLASGRLKIDGWAPMAAAMGFLEIRRQNGDLKHSFFAFGQVEELSIEIPTPIGMFYLREVGFGFGFRYTFAGLVAADQVKSPAQLIKVLDDVAKRQGDLATFSAWAPEADGDRLTLAMRALITVASASGKNKLSESERYVSNAIMFDVAAAIRSDLTFLMTARGWINTNYYTFVHGELKDGTKEVVLAREAIRTNPPLTGYVYISVPRQQFLGRLVADGKGYIGKTPEIHPVLRKMLSGVSWSATLFIQPGLFHFEMGWPYELKFDFEEKSDIHHIKINLAGGFIFRIEDAAMLYGIAFRGAGFAQLGGRVGGSSFGASAVARADFEIAAKFIAYIPILEPKNTLFYGAIFFSNTLSLRIAVWLRIKIFGGTISFNLSFSLSRTITVALELAVSPQELGARGKASVAFSAFGRTLRIGVSVSINSGALERARLKVERFMAIGLDNATPDPQKGLAPPPPPVPPAQAGKDVEEAVKNEDEKQTEIEKITSDEIEAASFWAILFEVPAPQTEGEQYYLMTLVPRDDTEVDGLLPPKGTFFAPPPEKVDSPVTDYWIGLKDKKPGKHPFLHVNPTTGSLHDVTHAFRATANYGAIVETTSTEALRLWHFDHECFLATKTVDGKVVKAPDDEIYWVELKQPRSIPISAERRRLPANRTEATELLRSAALDQLPEHAEDAELAISDYQREVEERRSATIAAIGESAINLAQSTTKKAGNWSMPGRAEKGLDTRDFGLTFVVAAGAIDELFKPEDPTTPRLSTFTLRMRTEKYSTGPERGPPADKEAQVHLLNPPERFFRTAKPRFAAQNPPPDLGGQLPLAAQQPEAPDRRDGIKLDWDLEPVWGKSKGAYHDPEFLLRHYLIKREVLADGERIAECPERTFETKSCAPAMRAIVEGKLVYTVIRPEAQLVDDLTDLPANYRNAFLAKGDDPLADYEEILKKVALPVSLQYTLVPVDIAGSHGKPEVWPIYLKKPKAISVPLLKAEVIFRHAGMDDVSVTQPAPPELFLRIDDALARAVRREGEDPQRLPGNGSKYEVLFRKERTVSGGIYGVDALSQARERPSAADFAIPRADDIRIEVILRNRETVLKNDELGISRPFQFSERFQPLRVWHKAEVDPSPIRGTAFFQADKTKLEALVTALRGSSEDVAAFRVAVRRISFDLGNFDEEKEGPREVRKHGPIGSGWLPADLALMVFKKEAVVSGKDPVLVETVIESYEHPRNTQFDALDFDDLNGEAGRLAVLHPPPDASLDNFAFHRFADRRRRTATRLSFNARPSVNRTRKQVFADPQKHANFIGGFDVFEADLSEINDEDRLAQHARRIARVQRLPDDQRGLEPSEIVDFEKVEALYPSETLRRSHSMGGGREDERSPWFSTAETLLLWPDVGLRRFLIPAPIEAEFAKLFDFGYPETISVTFKYDEATTAHWAFAANSKDQIDPAIRFYTTDVAAVIYPGQDLRPRDGKKWTTHAVTTYLRNLIWTAETTKQVHDAFADPAKQSSFRAVPLVIEAKRGSTFSAAVEITVDLISELHPFLADAIDMLRWHDESGDQPYRRYEPVLDGAPPTRAKSLEQFMAERPPQRDPYGWAFLRTIGLATGIRLFDIERSEYALAEDTLKRIKNVFGVLRQVYGTSYYMPELDLGQPFVDIMFRHEGLHTLHSFDAAIDAEMPHDEGGKAIKNEGLALVQLALRPVPELQDDASVARVGYARVIKEAGGTDVIIDARAADQALYEVIDVAGGAAGGTPVPLAQGGETNLAAKAIVGEGTTLADVIRINTGGLPPGPVALLRITAFSGRTLEAAHDNLVISDGCRKEMIDKPAALKIRKGPEAFERFAPLSGAAIDLLCFGVKDKITAQPIGEKSLKRLLAHAARRFAIPVPDDQSANWLDNMDARKARNQWQAKLADLMVFAERFTIHTAGHKTHTPYSLAAVVRQDPLRVAPRGDGVMAILLVHQDAWARRRRYIVRPFGRYENLWNAKLAGDQAAEAAPSLEPIAGIIYAPLTEADDESFAHRSVDITLPRSHPVLPPAFLAARRIDLDGEVLDKAEKVRVPGRLMEFVLSRHPEEILSETNRRVADGYQFDHMGLAFYREFSAPAWARGLDPEVNLIPEFGSDGGKRQDLPPLSFRGPTFKEVHTLDGADIMVNAADELPTRLADGWRGITAVRTTGIPHFYRLHAVAHAAAGVVVSDPAAAVIPEGRPAPRHPWPRKGDGDFPPNAWKTALPFWRVDVNDKKEITVFVVLPLLRNYDSVPRDEYELWLTDGALAPVFRLPDAAASYSLAIVATGQNAAHVSRSSEAELLPLPPDPKPKSKQDEVKPLIEISTYNLLMAGPRFAARYDAEYFAGSASTTPPRLKVAKSGDDWQVILPLKRRESASAAVAKPTNFSLPADADALLDNPAIIAIASNLWTGWQDVAPRYTANITLTRPPGVLNPAKPTINWTPFNDAINAIITHYRDFDTVGQKVIDILKDFTNTNNQQWLDRVGNGNEASFPTKIPTGIGSIPADTAAYFAISPRTAAWVMQPIPAGSSIARRQALCDALRESVQRNVLVRQHILDPMRSQMQSAAIDLVALDAASWDGYAPIARAITGDGPLKLKKNADISSFSLPFEFTRQLSIEAPDGKKWQDDAGELAALLELIASLESKLVPGSGRALAALEVVAQEAGLDPAKRPSIVFVLPHTLASDVEIDQKIKNLANAVTGSETLGWSAPSALTLRYPPSNAKLADPKYEDAFESKDLAAKEIQALASEQLLGPGAQFQVMLHRAGTFPLTEIVTRAFS